MQPSSLRAMFVVWALTLAFGMDRAWRFDATPGPTAKPLSHRVPEARSHAAWPRYHLLLFGHPRCACTRATLRELAEVMAADGSALDTEVLFYRPEAAGESWARTDLWRQAVAIPGVRVRTDTGGAEARRSGVTTSGHVLLYAPDGKLVFSGGLTSGRGQEGPSAGQSAVRSLLEGDSAQTLSAAPTFGCSLLSTQLAAVSRQGR